jgi:hypothetical protein
MGVGVENPARLGRPEEYMATHSEMAGLPSRAENAVFVTLDRRLLRRGPHLGLRVWSWDAFRHHMLKARRRLHG